MPFCSKPLGAALSIAAVATITIVSSGRAQQAPEEQPPAMPQVGSQPAPPAAAAPAPAPAPSEPTAGAPPPRHAARHGSPSGSAVAAATVNLRSGPGTDSELVATIPAGSRVQVGECNGEWCAVTWDGHNGYAIARNLSSGGAPRQAGGYPAYQGRRPGYPDGAPRQAGGYPAYQGQPGYSDGASRQAGEYPAYQGQPGYSDGGSDYPRGVYYGPGYAYGPAVVYGPGRAYYYRPGFYYRPGWGWRRRWW
jgi:Bacterial SH3 domain